MKKVAIIGGVAAGMSAAAQIRRREPGTEIVVFERGPVVSYGMCALPYYLSGLIPSKEQLVIYSSEYFMQKRNIDVRVMTEVLSIEPRERYLVARNIATDEEYEYEYDFLVLSTGANPVVPPFLTGLNNIIPLHNYNDAIRLKSLMDSKISAGKKNAVVIGGGNVGLEVAESLVTRGFSVTLIEKERRILPYLDEEFANEVMSHLSAKGITFKTEETVASVSNALNEATEVMTDKGGYPADLVVPALGVKPEVDLAAASGISLGQTGAIRVNQQQKTNIMNVFACGDCAEKYNAITGRPEYLPLGTYANKEGIIAGDNVAGRASRNKGITSTVVGKIFGLEFGKTGLSSAVAEAYTATETLTAKLPVKPREVLNGGLITIKLILEKGNERILGAQMLGQEGVAARLDVISMAIMNRLTVKDLLDVDYSYTPLLKPARDPLLSLAFRRL